MHVPLKLPPLQSPPSTNSTPAVTTPRETETAPGWFAANWNRQLLQRIAPRFLADLADRRAAVSLLDADFSLRTAFFSSSPDLAADGRYDLRHTAGFDDALSARETAVLDALTRGRSCLVLAEAPSGGTATRSCAFGLFLHQHATRLPRGNQTCIEKGVDLLWEPRGSVS